MEHRDYEHEMRASWELNGQAWVTAVREHLIPSRQAGTDAAILAACNRLKPESVLDVGCGEGWLTRAMSAACPQVVGIDSSLALLAEARSARSICYEALDYEALIHDASKLLGPWDIIVCNYSLLSDSIGPLLAALRSRLSSV
jgi:2-polyprenyl-3-methyl-5-hydroxy-6-metoxy-1,4-benzoquinol methylase